MFIFSISYSGDAIRGCPTRLRPGYRGGAVIGSGRYVDATAWADMGRRLSIFVGRDGRPKPNVPEHDRIWCSIHRHQRLQLRAAHVPDYAADVSGGHVG